MLTHLSVFQEDSVMGVGEAVVDLLPAMVRQLADHLLRHTARRVREVSEEVVAVDLVSIKFDVM